MDMVPELSCESNTAPATSISSPLGVPSAFQSRMNPMEH